MRTTSQKEVIFQPILKTNYSHSKMAYKVHIKSLGMITKVYNFQPEINEDHNHEVSKVHMYAVHKCVQGCQLHYSTYM